MDDPRDVIRCLFCRLVQYVTVSGNCRRCRQSLNPPELKEEMKALDASREAESVMRFSIKVGDRIRAARRRNNWSQLDLAQRIGVMRTWVSKTETYSTPTLASLEKVAVALGVEVWELVCTERDEQERSVYSDSFLLEMAALVPRLPVQMRAYVISEARRMAAGGR